MKIKHAAEASQLGLLAGIGGFAAERFYDFLVLLVLTLSASLIALKSIEAAIRTWGSQP